MKKSGLVNLSWVLILCLPSITRRYWISHIPIENHVLSLLLELLTEWFILLPVATIFYIGMVTSQSHRMDQLRVTSAGVFLDVTLLLKRVVSLSVIAYLIFRAGRVLFLMLLHTHADAVGIELMRSLTLYNYYGEFKEFPRHFWLGFCIEIVIHGLIFTYYVLLVFIQLNLYAWCYTRVADHPLRINYWRFVLVLLFVIFIGYHITNLLSLHPPHRFFLEGSASNKMGHGLLSRAQGLYLDLCLASLLPLMVAACGFSAALFRRRLVALLS